MGVDERIWKGTRKLGSLLGVEEDIDRRIQLALQAFRGLDNLWKYNSRVNVDIRCRAYKSIVESVLLYNCGTWALPVVLANKLDRAQRGMIRRVLGLKWSDKVTNADLYVRSGTSPASEQVLYAHWRLFGHTLRLNECTPARQAMLYYFVEDKNTVGRSGNHKNIASILFDEYIKAFIPVEDRKKVVVRDLFNNLATLAQDRDEWKLMVSRLLDYHVKQEEAKVTKRTEARHAKAANAYK